MVGLILAVAVSFLSALLFGAIGHRTPFVDRPGENALKVHEHPTPLLGGVGILVGVHLGLAVNGLFDLWLCAATIVVFGAGLVDDALDLAPGVRLGAELVAAILLVVSPNIPIDGIVPLGLGVVFVLVSVNAVNLLDGLDGLVGLVTIVSGVILAWASALGSGSALYGATLGVAVMGFLPLNWHPARLFLGDNGAYTIGVFLAYGVFSTAPTDLGTTTLVATGAMGIFFVDLVITIVRRAVNGTPLFSGDRSHVYDRLRDRGLSTKTIAASAGGAQGILGLGLVGAAFAGVSGVPGIALAAAVGIIILGVAWCAGALARESNG